MTIKQTIISFIFFASILTGCATFSIQTDSLVEQLKQKQKIFFNGMFPRFSILNSPSNHIDSIKCFDKKGNQVWLYPNNNTTFIFIKKSNGKKFKADFYTVIFLNDSLFSRPTPLFGKVRKIPVNDIKKITIKTETPRIKLITK